MERENHILWNVDIYWMVSASACSIIFSIAYWSSCKWLKNVGLFQRYRPLRDLWSYKWSSSFFFCVSKCLPWVFFILLCVRCSSILRLFCPVCRQPHAEVLHPRGVFPRWSPGVLQMGRLWSCKLLLFSIVLVTVFIRPDYCQLPYSFDQAVNVSFWIGFWSVSWRKVLGMPTLMLSFPSLRKYCNQAM